MTERQVIVSDDAQEDILYVAQYFIAVSRPDHAEKYAREVLAELATLNYMAVVLPIPSSCEIQCINVSMYQCSNVSFLYDTSKVRDF